MGACSRPGKDGKDYKESRIQRYIKTDGERVSKSRYSSLSGSSRERRVVRGMLAGYSTLHRKRHILDDSR